MPYKLAIRVAFTPEAKPSIRVERLIDGAIYDFRSLAFEAVSSEPYAPLHEVADAAGLFTCDVVVDGQGPYSATLHEGSAHECVAQMSLCADAVPPSAPTAP